LVVRCSVEIACMVAVELLLIFGQCMLY